MNSDTQVDPKTHLPKAVAGQSHEYFRFPVYRCIGIALWLAMTYFPMYIAKNFSQELNALFAYSDTIAQLVITLG
jgi:hypothetical protein